MPDVWASVAALDEATQERLAAVLESRGAEPQQQGMRRAFLAEVPFARDAQVLDVGCGTGVLTRVLARWPGVGSVVGVDTAPLLLDRARAAAGGPGNVEYRVADGRSLPFEGLTFDAVIFDSTLSHVANPEQAIAEACRVLKVGGCVAVFDGDYATTTVALDDHDPLQTCVDAMMANSVTDRRIMRRMPQLLAASGLEIGSLRSFGFVEASSEGYMLTIVDRGADMLCGLGQIGEEAAAALKAEARRRLAAGKFFGHIAYVGVVARKALVGSASSGA